MTEVVEFVSSLWLLGTIPLNQASKRAVMQEKIKRLSRACQRGWTTWLSRINTHGATPSPPTHRACGGVKSIRPRPSTQICIWFSCQTFCTLSEGEASLEACAAENTSVHLDPVAIKLYLMATSTYKTPVRNKHCSHASLLVNTSRHSDARC